jgi:hypothetical protein
MQRPPPPRALLRRALALALAATLVGACADDGGRSEPLSTPMPAMLIANYSGDFPCSNCAAIAAALWLRADGRFFLRQRYADDGATGPQSAYSLGRWRWDAAAAELRLQGVGPERVLRLLDANRLELQTASSGPHVLTRDPSLPPFADSIPVTGVAVVSGATATFRECLSQLELAVATDGAFGELRRQHRILSPRGRPALTAVDAHLLRAVAGDHVRELWVIDRVFSVNPDKAC